MDIFAHSLWTNLVFRKKYRFDLKNRLAAVFFGVAPDLISFVPSTFYLLFSGTRFPRPENGLPNIPVFNYALESYNYTHSLVIFGICVLLVWLLRGRKIYWPMFGWLVHILIDIPTHQDSFFPTPLFYPLSDWKFLHGFSWAEAWFFIPTWGSLIVIYAYLIFKYFRNKKTSGA